MLFTNSQVKANVTGVNGCKDKSDLSALFCAMYNVSKLMLT